MRVRFAPSPTGALHIGGARTALFNWLLARGKGGRWCCASRTPTASAPRPRTSSRSSTRCAGWSSTGTRGRSSRPSAPSATRRRSPRCLPAATPTARGATAEEVKAYKQLHGADRGFRGEAEAEGAVRLRVPDEGATVVHDVIRGDTRFEHIHLDDPVIARADGSVLYNFAVAIDDLDARITHVVRGEDHLSNTPKQLLVLEAARAAGFAPDAALPLYAHLPLLHGPDGKKLSKRHGAASVQELRDGGLPARGGAQLPRAARLGRGGRRHRDVHRAAHRALRAGAGQPQPGPVRRGQAALARTASTSASSRPPSWRAAWSSTPAGRVSSRRHGSARRKSRRSPTSGRSPARCSIARSRIPRRAPAGWMSAGAKRSARPARP